MKLFNVSLVMGVLSAVAANASTVKCSEAVHAVNFQFDVNSLADPVPTISNLKGTLLTAGGLVNYTAAKVEADETDRRAAYMDVFAFESIGGTYASNPSSAAAVVNLEVDRSAFREKASTFGATLRIPGVSDTVALDCKVQN